MIIGDMSYFEGTMNDKNFLQMMDNRWRAIYPAPFFDPIAMQTVADPKILIQWSRFFYEWHPIIHAAINKMVNYPITDFIFDTDDEHLRHNYEFLFDKLNVRDILVRAGLDYFICGNVFMSTLMPFKRMLVCPECGYSTAVKPADIKPSTSKLSMKCNNCEKQVSPDIEDINTQDINDMHVILWNPLNMYLEYDEILSKGDYRYSLPAYIKDGIIKGEKKYLEYYPQYFIDAAHQKRMIKIFPDKLMHMKRETHSATYNRGWGQPLITPVLKPLFHLLVLMRAQDALAIDQILPWTVISPGSNSGVDPASELDLGSWMGQAQKEYEEWKRNPVRKSFMPIPINAQIIGAQGKALMLQPEMDATINQILAGMGVPNEFIFGGLQWSGASVSLRMLENQFLNYRTMMQRVIDWIVNEVSVYFGYPAINVRMQNFKMADDVAQKDVYIQLNQAQKISDRTLLSEISPNIDPEEETNRIKEEQLALLKRQQIIQQAQSAMMPQQPGPQDPEAQQAEDEANAEDAKDEKASSNDRGKDLPEQNPPRAEGANKQI